MSPAARGPVAYRKLRRASFREALERSLVDVGAVMYLIALSGIFGYGIVFDRIPEVVSEASSASARTRTCSSG